MGNSIRTSGVIGCDAEKSLLDQGRQAVRISHKLVEPAHRRKTSQGQTAPAKEQATGAKAPQGPLPDKTRNLAGGKHSFQLQFDAGVPIDVGYQEAKESPRSLGLRAGIAALHDEPDSGCPYKLSAPKRHHRSCGLTQKSNHGIQRRALFDKRRLEASP